MNKRIMNIVNFVRGSEPRWEMDLLTPIAKQIEINNKYNIPYTFLLQYDAMLRDDIKQLFLSQRNDNMEIGVWFENCRALIEKIGLKWNGREGYDWDWYVNPGFLEAYFPSQRERIIDEVFRLYKEIFGEFPCVVGSWLMDSYSMAYMNKKYNIKAFCCCREQWAVDAYSLWGGYYSGGYYPSKYNMLCPAQTEENQINAPLFRMLGIDPIYGYDENKYSPTTENMCCYTMEPGGAFGQSSEIMDWYFKEYYTNPYISYAHATTGQEKSFGWEIFGEGYIMQIEKLVNLRQQGIISIEKLGDTGEAYKRTFETTPPSVLMALSDWSINNLKSIWYSSKYYRANLLLKDGELFFRDITKFDELYKERYLEEACETWDARYDNLPILDSLLWSKEGEECRLALDKKVLRLDVSKKDEKTLSIILQFVDNTVGEIQFSEKEIGFLNCSSLSLNLGIMEELTTLTVTDNIFVYKHNGFAYEVTVDGEVAKIPTGYKISAPTGKLKIYLR